MLPTVHHHKSEHNVCRKRNSDLLSRMERGGWREAQGGAGKGNVMYERRIKKIKKNKEKKTLF